MIAKTPEPPYYAVIFSNLQTDDLNGYGEMAEKMEKLAAEQPGYLGFESARDGLGIAISYWKDEKSMLDWKSNAEHQMAQKLGRDKWYSDYTTRICKVEREYTKKSSSFRNN